MLPFLLNLALASTSYAQTSDAQCGQGFQWMVNELGQTPCQVAATILSFCQGSSFTLWALPGTDWAYPGPTSTDPASFGWNRCDCSMPVYNLLSSCADCQGSRWVPWVQHTQQCNSSFTGDDLGAIYYLPITLPTTTVVPDWANWNSSSNPSGIWNETVSKNIAQTGDADGTSGDDGSSGGGGGSNAGAIAGGVVGGIAFLAIVGLGFWYYKRRQNKKNKEGSDELGEKDSGNDFTANTLASYGPPLSSPSAMGFMPNEPHHPNHPDIRQANNATASSDPLSSEIGSRVAVPELQSEDLQRPDFYEPYQQR